MGSLRKPVAVALSASFLVLIVLASIPDTAAADSRIWTSDTDWLSGTLDSNVVLQGTGDAAFLELRRSDFPDWMKMAPATIPPKRDGACTVWVDEGNYFLMFGGFGSSTLLGDLWKYNFSNDQWTQLNPPDPKPSNRTNAGCAYDFHNNVMVLFGGVDANFVRSTQTWEYDVVAGTWAQIIPPGNPRNMENTPMTYNSQARKVIIVGQNNVTPEMEVWAYDTTANTWTNRNPGGDTLQVRDGHMIAYDQLSDRTILFSGAFGTNLFCDTWRYLYAQNIWDFVRNCIANEDPNGRVGHGMTYRDTYAGVLMFGGYDGIAYDPATWVWIDSIEDWYLPPITASPLGKRNIALAHSPVDDASMFYGGYNSGLKNDTWVLARGYVVNVDAVWTSSINPANTGCDDPVYDRIYWNRTNNPLGAILRFQIATSDLEFPPAGWTFRGPGGFPGAHYTVSGTQIDAIHQAERYFRVLAKLKTTNGRVTPNLEDVTITYSCPPTPPSITNTNPFAGQTNVPRNTAIWVNFSEPMNTTTVRWTISGGVSAGDAWFDGNRTLRLTPTALLAECIDYTVQITQGKDANDGFDLVPGLAPNPWTFTTVCVNPFVTETDPPNLAIGVPRNKVIRVTFSEPMNTTTVQWTISGTTASGSWDPTETILDLTPDSLLTNCTSYIVEITQGNDKQDLPLGPGPVPNPWSFLTTGCPLTSPGGLTVTRSGAADILLNWNDVLGATGYKVYTSPDRFATFPLGWTQIGSPGPSQFTVPGHQTDGLTHYYVVRATDGTLDGPNSTMGVKVALSFTYSASSTNVVWVSVPFKTIYVRASNIATELGPGKADVIGKWDPAKQSAVTYFFSRGRWRGTDFTLTPGNGLYLGLRSSFTWVVTGTDSNSALTFTLNSPPKGNVNWISVPYTGVYDRASDLSTELGSGRIVEVGKWNPATQSSTRWFWDGSTWTGTDFAIAPGDGVYVIISSSFTWTPALITPERP